MKTGCPNPDCAAPKTLCLEHLHREFGECAHWQRRVYSLAQTRTFRVMLSDDEKKRRHSGHPPSHPDAIPWGLMELHRAQAMKNHDQTIERLQQRGGLSAMELSCVLRDMHWDEFDWDVRYNLIGDVLVDAVAKFQIEQDKRQERWGER